MQMQLALDAGFPRVAAGIQPLILDGFLPEFDRWRHLGDCGDYRRVVSPVDRVVYPNIVDLMALAPTIGGLLSRAVQRPCIVNHCFMRLSLAGQDPPHWAHHDGLMGGYSLMVYLNRAEHCQGGTALLEHVDGEPDDATWMRDTNRPEAWREVSRCDMAPNRAFVFPAQMWHAALPMGGFGSNPYDGRLVLTAFFDAP